MDDKPGTFQLKSAAGALQGSHSGERLDCSELKGYKLIANITKQAEAASRWIWIKWNERWQSQPGDGLRTS
ncbi:hypothetical protein N1851_033931 [Merluccius polli]|uniref:Uncharacterized protein n=1 Tax=Merluccius polli TaxID=89951 RepID=A0AA47NN53_MERPO|nr:hypothetical protein N1851_033931 [Merluccius polli]